MTCPQSHPQGGAVPGARRQSAQELGFTLFEVLVSALVLSIGIAFALQTTVIGLKLSQKSHNEVLVTKGILEYQLEQLRSLPWANLKGYTDNVTPHDIPAPGMPTPPVMDCTSNPVGDLCGGGVVQRAQFWVESYAGVGDSAAMRRVRIEVQWTDPDKHQRTPRITTLISCKGLTDPSSATCP